jgi:hypothetical protein
MPGSLLPSAKFLRRVFDPYSRVNFRRTQCDCVIKDLTGYLICSTSSFQSPPRFDYSEHSQKLWRRNFINRKIMQRQKILIE